METWGLTLGSPDWVSGTVTCPDLNPSGVLESKGDIRDKKSRQFRKKFIPPSDLGSSPGSHLGCLGCSSIGSLEHKPDNFRVKQFGPRGCCSSWVVLFLHLTEPWRTATLWGRGESSTVRDNDQLPGENSRMDPGSGGHLSTAGVLTPVPGGQRSPEEAVPRPRSAFL